MPTLQTPRWRKGSRDPRISRSGLASSLSWPLEPLRPVARPPLMVSDGDDLDVLLSPKIDHTAAGGADHELPRMTAGRRARLGILNRPGRAVEEPSSELPGPLRVPSERLVELRLLAVGTEGTSPRAAQRAVEDLVPRTISTAPLRISSTRRSASSAHSATNSRSVSTLDKESLAQAKALLRVEHHRPCFKLVNGRAHPLHAGSDLRLKHRVPSSP